MQEHLPPPRVEGPAKGLAQKRLKKGMANDTCLIDFHVADCLSRNEQFSKQEDINYK